jgi:hypothetical protein
MLLRYNAHELDFFIKQEPAAKEDLQILRKDWNTSRMKCKEAQKVSLCHFWSQGSHDETDVCTMSVISSSNRVIQATSHRHGLVVFSLASYSLYLLRMYFEYFVFRRCCIPTKPNYFLYVYSPSYHPNDAKDPHRP